MKDIFTKLMEGYLALILLNILAFIMVLGIVAAFVVGVIKMTQLL